MGLKFDLPFKWHLFIGAVIRLALVLYSGYHDSNYDVSYTDVDYKVFTDAARHVIKGDSPYKRHTYRYSPIIAYIMTPNVYLTQHFGKILFSAFDVLLAVAVKILVQNQLVGKKVNKDKISKYSSLFWLYNPLSIAISTRGNADSVPCFLIIVSLLFLQTNLVKSYTRYVLSGIFLGISIHLRIYPLVFSFPMYLSLGRYKINRSTKLSEGLLILLPNLNQIVLALSCVITLAILTYGFYFLYGYEFLFETYIYHLFRKDTRHNFSVLFYYFYLTTDELIFDVVKVLTQFFLFLVLFVLSVCFGCEAKTLPFGLFCQAVVLVAYNSVVTSQYFVWFISLFPLVVHNLVLTKLSASFYTILWFLGQACWLLPAYYLEFEGRNTFFIIWTQGCLFFCVNVYILAKLITCYNPNNAFGIKRKLK